MRAEKNVVIEQKRSKENPQKKHDGHRELKHTLTQIVLLIYALNL